MITAFYISFLEVRWIDVIDILLVSYLFYQFYKMLSNGVAIRIFIGIISIYLLYVLVRALDMEMITAILGQFISIGLIAAVVIFQQEIRRFLLMVGKTTQFNESFFRNIFKIRKYKDANRYSLTPVIDAVKVMSASNTGALIVFARTTDLKFYADSGDSIDALLSKRLLLSIFYKNSPLHDGAVIIAKGRVVAARCVLPVSESELPAHYGLRHRSALGMSELTDAVVLIVSEETGQISIAHNGVLEGNLSMTELRQKLNFYLYQEQSSSHLQDEFVVKPA